MPHDQRHLLDPSRSNSEAMPLPSVTIEMFSSGAKHHAIEEKSAASSWYGVTWKERISHFTWAWFTFPMSTGGIALLLNATPNRFPGLDTIGKIVFVFDLIIFLGVCAGITTRFIIRPEALKNSLTHPTESLFFATFWLALMDVLGGIQEYGVPNTGEWLVVVMRILFWIYTGLTFCSGVFQYLQLFKAKKLTIQSMMPGWVLPMFPVMLSGTLATLVAPTQPIGYREPIIIAGFTFQGLGWMVSCMVYALYIHRLIEFGLPAPDHRGGMFIAVGPPSFTGLALIGLSQALPDEAPYFGNHPDRVMVLQTIADFTAIFLWSLSFWFFCLALISVLSRAKEMSFRLGWWAFVFPNVGFTIATIRIGRRLESQAILGVGSAMTVLLIMTWIFVFISHIRAVVKRQIMMPGMDEDKDQYKADDRKHNIPVPPSMPPSMPPSRPMTPLQSIPVTPQHMD